MPPAERGRAGGDAGHEARNIQHAQRCALPSGSCASQFCARCAAVNTRSPLLRMSALGQAGRGWQPHSASVLLAAAGSASPRTAWFGQPNLWVPEERETTARILKLCPSQRPAAAAGWKKLLGRALSCWRRAHPLCVCARVRAAHGRRAAPWLCVSTSSSKSSLPRRSLVALRARQASGRLGVPGSRIADAPPGQCFPPSFGSVSARLGQ